MTRLDYSMADLIKLRSFYNKKASEWKGSCVSTEFDVYKAIVDSLDEIILKETNKIIETHKY